MYSAKIYRTRLCHEQKQVECCRLVVFSDTLLPAIWCR